MGCGQSSASSPRDTRHTSYNNTDNTGTRGHSNDRNGTRTRVTDDGRPPPAYDYDNTQRRDSTPPPRKRTPPPRKRTPPPRERTPPPPEPSPPPREPTPPSYEPTPPPKEPTPPPREPTPPPRQPTPPPREPTPKKPTPSPQDTRKHNVEPETRAGSGANKQSKPNVYGIIEEPEYEFRQRPEDLDKHYSDPPESLPFVDRDFGPHVAIQGERVEWKRPGEFRDAPVLFSEGTTRYDIGQGAAGTCWFLSMVAMLADRPQLFERVVPKDAWSQDGGYFYCYFWRYGEWEAVYIDDFLPVVHGTELWGAKSADDRNEMWPALLEKAFARFHGSYNSVYGGQSGDAFLALTGGCSEYIDFDEELEENPNQALALHRRLKNAVANGECMLTTEVPSKYDGQHGLVGGHAYSLTDAVTVPTNHGQSANLVRVRNPWGNTEWKGPWSDGSKEWSTIDEGSVPHANTDDGEFWISLSDFVKYFSGVTLCSMVPDFDKDGCTDSLNHLTTMFGDWVGETAAGFQNRIDNPRYAFQITDEGMGDDGLVPIVLQICQKLKHRKSNKFSIRVDLYKILCEKQEGEELCVVELLGEKTNVYKCERQMSNRYAVEPGYYAAVPSCIDAGQEKEFLVRTFTPAPLYDVRELGRSYAMMESTEFKPPGKEVIRFTEALFGRWQRNYNAGGQVSHPTFHTNPQLEFEIPNRGQEQLVNFTLMQEKGDETFPIGLRVFEMDQGYQIPEPDDKEHQNYLYSHYDSCPRTIEGQQGAFVMGSSADVTHQLPPGRYFVLLHADDSSQEKRFALVMRATCNINPRAHQFE